MKKILFSILVLISITASAQIKMFGHGLTNLNGSTNRWYVADGTDSVLRVQKNAVTVFKPIDLAGFLLSSLKWDANTSIANQGGDVEIRTGNGTPSAKVLATQQFVAYRGIAYQSNQLITTAGATTIGDNIITVYVDPPSVLASATITLPANPVDGQMIRFMFGGTITAGNPVVTSLSIIANTGQTMLSSSAPSATSNDLAIYQYRAANTKWYRAN
jgi:hypothetical protein